MTAHCPICGGKWEPDKYDLDLRGGDEHDIICGYCDRRITFILDKETIDLKYNIIFTNYEQYIADLEKKLLEAKKELEETTKKIKEILEE
jgi:hypothetical protein